MYTVHVILLINRITQTVVYIWFRSLVYIRQQTTYQVHKLDFFFFINVCHTYQPALWNLVSQIQKKKWREIFMFDIINAVKYSQKIQIFLSFQMTRVCLATSTSLLNDLVEKTLTLYTKRQSPVPGLLLSAVEAGSNIVKAVSMAAASQNDLWFYREKLTQSIQLVELFLRVCIWFFCLLFYFLSRIFGYPVNNGRFWIW